MGIFNRRSFRVDILTAFGTLLLVIFLAVIIYNYRSTSRMVLMLSDDLMDQTTQSVIDKTTNRQAASLEPLGRGSSGLFIEYEQL